MNRGERIVVLSRGRQQRAVSLVHDLDLESTQVIVGEHDVVRFQVQVQQWAVWSVEAVRLQQGLSNLMEDDGLDGPDGPLLHLDLKPNNVMFAHDDLSRLEVKVVDYGNGALLSSTREDYYPLASIHFRSPEQILRQTPTAPSDIYSLGCLAYYLLTGAYVFPSSSTDPKDSPDHDHLHSPPPVPSAHL